MMTPVTEAERQAIMAEARRHIPDVYDTSGEPWWDEDTLAPARGIVVGLCITVALFALAAVGVGAWLGWWL